MVDIPALLKALPVSALAPNCLASLGGLVDVPKDRDWQERIDFLEPPAGQRVPYIDPVTALEKLLRRKGVPKDVALVQAQEAAAGMRVRMDAGLRACFFEQGVRS